MKTFDAGVSKDTQTKAGFKKEILSYFRTNKITAISLVIIGLAAFSPLMITGLGAMMDAMSDVYEELGTDITGMTELLGSSASVGVASAIESINGAALIVVLLLLNRAAGGEQKKRAMIIPKSAGLRSFAYIFPKFIIYPLSIFIFTVVAAIISWVLSALLFEVNDVAFRGVLLAGVLSGVSLMLYVCFHLTLGTATGKAGLSASVCIAASIFLPTIFSLVSTDYMYNPFALELLATMAISSDASININVFDLLVTVVFALAIMGVTFYIALFAQNARKIDNTGNEIDL